MCDVFEKKVVPLRPIMSEADLNQQRETLRQRGICVVIPTYNNGGNIGGVVTGAMEQCADVIVVNDGSTDTTATILSDLPKEGLTVVTLDRNRGKGAALKNGMKHISELYPEAAYFITVDADGQHRLHDILKVRDALNEGASMVLTVRDFQGKIPFFSRLGNGLSRWVRQSVGASWIFR